MSVQQLLDGPSVFVLGLTNFQHFLFRPQARRFLTPINSLTPPPGAGGDGTYGANVLACPDTPQGAETTHDHPPS
jgi:hypothetical protein